MKSSKLTKIKFLLALGVGICLVLPDQAHAYLDLGTGSLIFQFLVAAFLGGAYMARSYLRKIKNYILSLRKRDKN